MASEFDDVLDQEPVSALPPLTSGLEKSEFDDVLDGEVTQQQNYVRTVVDMASKDNPEAAAERVRLSQSTGLPPDVVARNQQELKRREIARAIDLQRMMRDSPVLFRQMTDPTFTAAAIDDLDTLRQIEKSFTNIADYAKSGEMASDAGGAAKSLALGATVGVGKMIFDVFGAATDLVGLDYLSGGYRTMSDNARQSMDAFGLQADTSTGRAVKSGLESAGQNLALLPLGLERGLFQTAEAAGAAVAGAMSVGVGADSYQRARGEGVGRLNSALYGLNDAGVEFLMEKIPAGQLFKGIELDNSLMKQFAQQTVTEGWTEQVTTIAQDFNEWLALHPEKTTAEFLAERPEAAYQTFIATLIGTGVQTTAIAGINKLVEKASNQALVYEQDRLTRQLQLAGMSALRERSPDQFRANMEQVVANAPEGAPTEIHVDAEVLNQLTPEMQALLPESVRAQIPDALAMNATVPISMADVLTIAPGTELEQILNDNARVGSPEAPSRVEADKAAEFIQQDAERVLQQAQDQSAWQSEVDTVHQTIKDQLDQAGRFTSDVNEGYARLQSQFFSVMASRLGITPAEMYQRFSVKVAGQMGQGEVLNAEGGQGETIPDGAFASWDINNDSVIDNEGNESSGEDYVLIEKLFVPENARRKGGARALLRKTLRDIQTQHPGMPIKLAALPDSGADQIEMPDLVSFYESEGFDVSNTDGSAVVMTFDGNVRGNAANLVNQSRDITQTPEFKSWFGDSKVVDAEGRPLVVYHGTAETFDVFSRKKQREGKWGKGFYFTTSEEEARNYGSNVIAVYLKADRLTDTLAGGPGGTTAGEGKTWAMKGKMLANGGYVYLVTSPTQIKSATGNSGAFDPNDPNILRQSVSTRLPTAKKSVENPLESMLVIGLDAAKADPKAFEKNVELIRQYPNFRDNKSANTPDKAAEQFIRHVVDNLLWLHDQIDPVIRARAQLWYDGANAIATRWSDKYGLTDFQISGVLAVLSPQKDWFQNVSLGERVLDIMSRQQNFTWSDEMSVTAAALPALNPEDVGEITGKMLGELQSDYLQAMWVRVYDQTYNERGYRIVTPEGEFGDWVVNADGKTRSKVAWGSFNEIGKAVSIFKNGEITNISESLGEQHKVRNFYNNIFSPNSEHGDVTIDTHAVAAALLRPLSGGATEVLHNFGSSGAASSSVFGSKGTYGIYAEAYRRAAAERGILPRQMQSITWEAVRSLFTPGFKSQAANVATIEAIWDQYRNRRISLDDARKQLFDVAGGISTFEWERPSDGAPESPWASSYTDELDSVRRTDGAPGRGDGGVSSEPAAGSELLTQPAYHGTPYRGIDKFSTDKIGTGEGAQAYGWGLYFAGKREIAEHYRGALTPRLGAEVTFKGKPVSLEWLTEIAGTDPAASNALLAVNEVGGFNGQTIKTIVEELRNGNDDTAADWLEANQSDIEFVTPKGQLYEVDIPEDSEMLLWDKPLSEQSETVRDALMRATPGGTSLESVLAPMDIPALLSWAKATDRNSSWDEVIDESPDTTADELRGFLLEAYADEDMQSYLSEETIDAGRTGESIYRQLATKLGSDKLASEQLASLGIKGIKYLDGTSRSQGDGTFNYVVFSGDDVAIRDQFYQRQQQTRGTFNPQTLLISLGPQSDLSTFLHESGHFFLEVMADLAAQPDAPAQVREDMDKVLAWFGVLDLATWQGYTLNEKREHHEKWAESFEQYLLEGKAPSTELQSLFRQFRSWLVNVYRSLTDFMRGRNLEVNDEIRHVFDRMLATDAEIAQAEEVAGLLPDFDGTNEAIERLQARKMRDLKWTLNARSKFLKQFTREAREVRKLILQEVLAEFDQRPDAIAARAIRKVRNKDGAERNAKLEGIAAAQGYGSVQEMDVAVQALGPVNEAVEVEVDRRMTERYGEISTPEALEKAANEAVYNEAHIRSLATELKAQQEALSERQSTGRVSATGRPITVNALVAAAKQFAEDITARRRVRDLKSAAQQHRAATARATKRWEQATRKGETKDAIQAQKDRLLNTQAAKTLLEAQAEIEKTIGYLRKFNKDSIRQKLPPEYLDQIDKLLERVDLRASVSGKQIDKRASLKAWIESQNELGIDPIIPDNLLEDIRLTSYKMMTVEEIRGLHDTIRNIEHLGKLKSKLLKAKDKREFDAAATAWADNIRANGGEAVVRLEPDGRLTRLFKGAWAEHRKLNSLVRQMDGGQDGGIGFRLLIASMNEQGTQEDVALEQAAAALGPIFAPVDALPGGLSGGQVYIPEISASLSRAARLAIALNWGNTQNRQRVMDGDGWTQAQVEAVLATLTPTELEFVNKVWEHLDSYWPEIKAKQQRVSGLVEEKVAAEPFAIKIADGTIVEMRGGYYPIKYDPDRSVRAQINDAKQAAMDMLRGAMLRPTTRRGHTKARVDEVYGRPIRKDLAPITQHITQVAHDLAWHEWAIDANRLLADKRIAAAIREHYGPETHRAMTDTVEAIVTGDVGKQTDIDKFLLMIRSNVTRSIMGVSATTALLQPFGLTQSMARIGVTPVLKGAWRWAGDAVKMESSLEWIHSKSDFMRLRAKTFNRDLREINQQIQGRWKVTQVMDAVLFAPMQKMQMIADVPTWIGAYEKALSEGQTEELAVAIADEAVLSSQGGGSIKDLSDVQRNHPFLTQFYSYFNATLQLVAESTALTNWKNPRAVAGWVGDMALLAMIPGILPALITYALKGGGEDDDPEDWAKRIAGWQASYLLGMFVGLRDLPAIWGPFDYQGPPAGKLFNDGKRLVQQANQGEIDDPAVLAAISLIGTVLGLPTTQVIRSYKGWQAWDEGDAPASSILFGPPPKD